jgi:hypothetical protein
LQANAASFSGAAAPNFLNNKMYLFAQLNALAGHLPRPRFLPASLFCSKNPSAAPSEFFEQLNDPSCPRLPKHYSGARNTDGTKLFTASGIPNHGLLRGRVFSMEEILAAVIGKVVLHPHYLL